MYEKKKVRRGRAEDALNAKRLSRDSVLANLSGMLEDMNAKMCKGRVRDKAAFDLRLRALKAFAYSASVFSGVLDASENEAILSRLDALEARDGGSLEND